MYDRVAISLHGPGAQTNFPATEYGDEAKARALHPCSLACIATAPCLGS